MDKLIVVLLLLLLICFCVLGTFNKPGTEENVTTKTEVTTELNTISIYNSKRFKDALYSSWRDDSSVCEFFNSHIGDIIEFDGYVSDRKNDVIYSEISDCLFNYKINTYNEHGQKNINGTSVIFIIECFSSCSLRMVCPEATDNIEIGTDLHIVAEIEEYESGIVSIVPVKITILKAATENR